MICTQMFRRWDIIIVVRLVRLWMWYLYKKVICDLHANVSSLGYYNSCTISSLVDVVLV